MRDGISFTLSSCDRQRLQATVADPKSPPKQVWRARIVLVSGGGLGTSAIMAETGKAPITPDHVSEIVRLSLRQTDDLVVRSRQMVPICLDKSPHQTTSA